MQRTYTSRDYHRAEQMLRHHRARLVTGQLDRPGWLAKSESFWYRTSTPSGGTHVLVDPVARTRRPAFDPDRLAAGLTEALGIPVEPATLVLSSLDVDDHGLVIGFAGRKWRCSLDDYECTPVETPNRAGPGESLSPDGRWVVYVRDHDLWARDHHGAEFRLTHGGCEDNAYAVEPTFGQSRSLTRTVGAVPTPVVRWSPDGTRLLTHRLDERAVEVLHMVESTPRSGRRPVTHTYRYPMPGDDGQPMAHLVVIDLERRTVTASDADPLYTPYMSPLTIGRAWWSADGGTVYALDVSRGGQRARLLAMDPATGKSRVIVDESSATRVEPTQLISDSPMIDSLATGEVLWYSQRDGWGHLYRYDDSGALLNQVTAGDWAVRAITHIDQENGVVYFLAGGLVESDPYVRQLCRVNLDGTGFARLTDDVDDHVVRASPSGQFFIDSASYVDRPPVTVVRDRTGQVVLELARADVTALAEAGWTAPERFTAKAADGVTDIYGILWRPYGFDPHGRYPVIDHVYPGPQTHRAPAGFDNTWTGDPEAYAALGFAVVAIDGRGTPGRSKEFHDLSYGRLDEAGGLADHIAAIRQLGARNTWLDTDRVGITGHSGGGFATARALLAHPDFYRVGVASSGDHDIRQYLSIWGEFYHGPWDPNRYRAAANAEFARNLVGKLLLIHGELDDNVPVYQTLGLVDALIEANRDFDMLVVPGVGHSMFHREAYVLRRKWDYFVRHLMQATPPANYRLGPIPISAARGGL